MTQISIFDENNRLSKLSSLGDPLEKLNSVINWNVFNPVLKKALAKEVKSSAGRPAYRYDMMFKILILQRIYNISDDQTEYQINDRVSFQRFLGLHLGDKIPDAKTIWLFRDTLVKTKVIDRLFQEFNNQLAVKELITHKGTIVDATFIEAPHQHTKKDDYERIKEGKLPEDLENEKDQKKRTHRIQQLDTYNRWTRKHGEQHYGIKNHTKVDADSKLIISYSTTDAACADGSQIIALLDENDKNLYADSAYYGKPISEKLPEGITNNIHERGARNHPLTEEQKQRNGVKSKTRCRIEHIYGFMTVSMHGLDIRSKGKARAEFFVGLTNLIYNMCRFSFLHKSALA